MYCYLRFTLVQGGDEKSRGLFEAQNGAGFGLWPEPALSKTRIMSSQLLRSLSRLWERERERAHERVGVSDGAMERENEKDGEIVKLIRHTVWWEDQYESLSLLLSSGAQLPGQPMRAPLSAGRTPSSERGKDETSLLEGGQRNSQ